MKEIFQRAIDSLVSHVKTFNGWDVLDIVVVTCLFFGFLLFLKRNNLLSLVKYIAAACIVGALLYIARDKLIVSGSLAAVLFLSAILLLAVAFQTELKRGVLKIASARREADHYNTVHNCTDEELHACVSEMVRACTTLAKNNTGALLILHNHNMPQHIIDSGTRLNAVVSAPLLECIFNTKGPLHDGAVIVEGNKMLAAGCFLPLSQSLTLPKELGTRHRAGIGITENVDVLTVIVSEENGVISVAKNGVLARYYDSHMLTQTFEQFYGLKAAEVKRASRRKRV